MKINDVSVISILSGAVNSTFPAKLGRNYFSQDAHIQFAYFFHIHITSPDEMIKGKTHLSGCLPALFSNIIYMYIDVISETPIHQNLKF